MPLDEQICFSSLVFIPSAVFFLFPVLSGRLGAPVMNELFLHLYSACLVESRACGMFTVDSKTLGGIVVLCFCFDLLFAVCILCVDR
ncbi:hypothetical protein HDK90DRAFT_322391 [Phyllosticta capitalensis]|uniref:Uncharacterized protein n=1 Tax=Phyllosticta capitalensis TaxID=121624 RepID=A0ABR1YHR9_9PEZI